MGREIRGEARADRKKKDLLLLGLLLADTAPGATTRKVDTAGEKVPEVEPEVRRAQQSPALELLGAFGFVGTQG